MAKRLMLTVLKPGRPPVGASGKRAPIRASDYVTLPAISIRATYPMLDILSVENIARLQVFTNSLERTGTGRRK